MKYLLILVMLIPAQGSSQNVPSDSNQKIPSGRYSWIVPAERKRNGNTLSSEIFAGSAHDMEWIEVTACSLLSSKKKNINFVPADEEYLFIIKSGKLGISFRDSSWTIGPGSIALLLPEEEFSLQSAEKGDCSYYLMKYRSRQPADLSRGKASGGSFVRDWTKLKFRAHDRGGVRSYFEQATAMSRRFEMHVTTLKPGLKSHDPHTHRAEEIILMLEDTDDMKSRTQMLIGDKSYKGESGDLYYVGSNLLHGIQNTGTTVCSYFAFQFE